MLVSDSNMEIIQRFLNKYLRIIVNDNDTSPMTLYTTTYHTLETRLKSSVRNTPTDWSNANILAIDHWAYTLQDLHKLPNVLLNVSDSL